MTKFRVIGALCVLSLFAICLCIGCVSDSSSNSNADLSNTLVYAGENEDTINPILNTHDEISDLIFSGLMKYDGSGYPVADLAESYTYDEESMTYIFNLRKGVLWHDGTPFTAKDVVFTYNALLHDDSLTASITTNYEDIDTITAPDDFTVLIKMKNYTAKNAMLGYFTIGILPEHLMKGKDINTDSFNQHPVGTGRYVFTEWDTAGKMIILEKNKNYYGKIPNIDRVIYKTVSVESTKATMLMTGEADLAWLNANYAKQFRGRNGYKNIDFKTADYRAMSMDFRTPFWQRNGDSIAVLNYAIDKNAIVASVLDGRGIVGYSPIQMNSYGGNKISNTYSYNLDKFHAEMEKLGWKKGSDGIYERNGEKFKFTIQVRDYEEERVDIANLCSQMLNEAGVNMEIVTVTKFDWKSGYNGFLSGYATQFDPDMIYVNYVTGASDNTMQYSNAKVDKLLNDGRHSSNEDKRRQIYAEFEEVYTQEPGVVIVAFLDGNYVSTDKLSGLDTTRLLGHHAVGVMWNIEEWTLSK